MGERVIDLMSDWQMFLDQGLTTFPEHGINSRSDCHAWSAHPMYDFLSITCGIRSAAPGFKRVEIKPSMGDQTELEGRMPHPDGEIFCHFVKLKHNVTECIIELPLGIDGTFIFQDGEYELTEGKNYFIVKP